MALVFHIKTVDDLIKALERLNIDHQEVKVQLQIKNSAGMPISERVAISNLRFEAGGLALTLEGDVSA